MKNLKIEFFAYTVSIIIIIHGADMGKYWTINLKKAKQIENRNVLNIVIVMDEPKHV